MGYRVYVCGGPRCSARPAPLAPILERTLAESGLAGAAEIRMAGCLGRCDRGPNLIVHPGGSVYVGLDAASALLIVEQHLAGHAVCAAFLDDPHR
ncbi:MAG TPA: (2Fe-2S) ferredoxin domain-containing protein [Herpetosiphonaceae bacterium]